VITAIRFPEQHANSDESNGMDEDFHGLEVPGKNPLASASRATLAISLGRPFLPPRAMFYILEGRIAGYDQERFSPRAT
jgi:hypothetical protein